MREVDVSIVANMSELSFDEFWMTLESHNWTHPFDDEGRRRSYDDMPASVDDLVDDPYRSLAGAVKRAGGYAKDKAPFSEFRWADFLRRRIPRELIERDFGRGLAVAMNLAQSTEAAVLPGWRPRGFNQKKTTGWTSHQDKRLMMQTRFAYQGWYRGLTSAVTEFWSLCIIRAMDSEPKEIELKLRVAPEDIVALRNHPHFAGILHNSSRETLNSVYFDTNDRSLRDHGVTLRVRHIGDKRVQTVKAANHGSGFFERSEWEQVIEGDLPDLTRVKDTALGPIFTDDDLRNALKPVFETRIERTAYHLNVNGTDIIMAVDEGADCRDRFVMPGF